MGLLARHQCPARSGPGNAARSAQRFTVSLNRYVAERLELAPRVPQSRIARRRRSVVVRD